MLVFKELKFKNFLSFGQVEQVVKLDNKAFQLITGLNKDKDCDDTGNRNGCGKSSFFQALMYGLYGKSIGNKVTLPTLVNNINKKNMSVTVSFTKDDIDYTIERGRNPTFLRFFKNNEEVIVDESQGDSRNTQDEIEKVLGMNDDLFCQTILLSCQVPIFMDQSTANQKIILEKILGVDIITEKIGKLKEIIKETKNELANEDFKVNTLKSQQETLKQSAEKNYEYALNNYNNWETKHKNDLSEVTAYIQKYDGVDFDKEKAIIKGIEEYNKSVEAFNNWYNNYKRAYDNYSKATMTLDKKKEEFDELNKVDFNAFKELFAYNEALSKEEQEYVLKLADNKTIRSQINVLNSQIDFNKTKMESYAKELNELQANKCPTCGQVINANKTQVLKNELSEKIIKLNTENEDLLKQVDELTDKCNQFVVKSFEYKSTEPYKTSGELLAQESYLTVCKQTIETLTETVNDAKKGLEELGKMEQPVQSVEKSIFNSMNDLITQQTTLDVYKKSLVELTNQLNPYAESLDKAKKDVESISTDVDTSKLAELSISQLHNETLLKLLNSPTSFIRKAIMEQALGCLNDKVKYYLTKLGSLHTVHFNSDMSIDIIQNGLEFGYVSSGEMGRISLALTFAFRDVWESLNSNKMNLLMIDEVLDRSGLDTNGMMMLVDCIRSFKDKNIFLVTHNDGIINQIPDKIMIVKESNFSTIET